jgi:hypothetical protein
MNLHYREKHISHMIIEPRAIDNYSIKGNFLIEVERKRSWLIPEKSFVIYLE